MKKPNTKSYESRARIMKALAHPTRLFIVDQLAAHEYCVNELTAMIGCDMSTVSRHLSILHTAGVVVSEKRGVCIYFTIRCRCVRSLFTCADTILRSARKAQELVT